MGFDSLKEDIRNRLDIVDVISGYTSLKVEGSKHKGLSPFTNEKSPSFYVSSDKGVYYCFSSHQGGDMFNFIQSVAGVDFIGALEILAEKAGLDINDYKGKGSSIHKHKKEMGNILEEILSLYRKGITPEVIQYLTDRGMDSSDIEKWELGYAPDSWNFISNDSRFDSDKLESVGVVIRGEKGLYDRFRDRIIFPLRDDAGRLIGFAGRVLRDSPMAKYINSPETELYHKSLYLYGLTQAKASIRKYDFTLLTEGYLDVIFSSKTGFTNVVATSGTAATEQHISILKKLSKRIVIAFDGDEAGIRATIKAARLALSAGMEIKVIEIESGKDPADIVKENKDKWSNAVKEACSIVGFLLKKISERTDDSENRIAMVDQQIIPIISSTSNPVLKDKYISDIAEFCNVSKESIKQRIDAQSSDIFSRVNNVLPKPMDINRQDNLALNIVSIMEYMEDKGKTIPVEVNELVEEIKKYYSMVKPNSKVSEFAFSISAGEGEIDFENIKKNLFKVSKEMLMCIYKDQLKEFAKSEEKCENITKRLQRLNKMNYGG